MSKVNRVSTLELKEKKNKSEKITMLTAYDYNQARIVDEAGIDMILVGDSLGMVVLGYENTLAVSLEEMIHHGKAVVRGSRRAMVVVDMPFMTYQVNRDEALRNAGRLVQETGAQAVKVEGGRDIAGAVQGMARAGIPVMGHLGLTPQSVGQLGGYKVQGRDKEAAREMLEDAAALEKAGAFSLVLECVPRELAACITRRLSIPVIGIGAGLDCDGQVLVFHDVLGLFDEFRPKFVKQYQELRETMVRAIQGYRREVENGDFPGVEHTFNLGGTSLEELLE